VWALVLWVCW